MGGGHKPVREGGLCGMSGPTALKVMAALALVSVCVSGLALQSAQTAQTADRSAMDRVLRHLDEVSRDGGGGGDPEATAQAAAAAAQAAVQAVAPAVPESERAENARARKVLGDVQSMCRAARQRAAGVAKSAAAREAALAEAARARTASSARAAAPGGWHPWVTNTDPTDNPPAHFPVCSWAGQAKYKPDRVARELPFVRVLNKLKLNYTMHAGSLLGAYRHGGRLTGDGDCDLRFPVWQNEVGREVCEKYAQENPDRLPDTTIPDDNEEMLLKFRSGEGEWTERFCGQTRSQWVKTVREHFGRVMMPRLEKSERFSMAPSAWGGYRTSTGCDFVVSIHDDEISDSHFCRCPWHDTFAMCMEDTTRMLDRHFHGNKNWQVPARSSPERTDQTPATGAAPARAAAPAAPPVKVPEAIAPRAEDAVISKVCDELLN